MNAAEQALATLRDYVERSMHLEVCEALRPAALKALNDLDAYHQRLQEAIGHLQAILNEARTCHQSLEAERAAREWLLENGGN